MFDDCVATATYYIIHVISVSYEAAEGTERSANQMLDDWAATAELYYKYLYSLSF